MTLATDNIQELNARLDAAEPAEIVRCAADEFGRDLIMTSSFGAESMCLLHLATRVMPDVRIVFVNTGYLFPETIKFMEQMRRRFDLRVLEYHSHHDPFVYLTVHGETDPRCRTDVDACCAANKNEPFDRAMKELRARAWLRGVRADQSDTRAKMQVVQWSGRNNCWALSPILRWSQRQIHAYMTTHDLPYHPLWHLGYASIGCNPHTCTRPVGSGEDARHGRWAGSAKKECGINLDQGAGI